VDNPFSWDYLTAPLSETPTFGPFSIVYVVLFSVTFVICAFLQRWAPRAYADHKLKRDLIFRASSWMMWVTGVGLLFFVPRAMRFQFLTFEKRIWLYLCFLAYAAAIVYLLYYYQTNFRPRLVEFERRRERRKYAVPAASTPGGASTRGRRGGQQRRGKQRVHR
jgi:hypothetical protein